MTDRGKKSRADDSDDETIPSSNIRKVFTRLQNRLLLTLGGGASAINGPASQLKDGAASKNIAALELFLGVQL